MIYIYSLDWVYLIKNAFGLDVSAIVINGKKFSDEEVKEKISELENKFGVYSLDVLKSRGRVDRFLDLIK